jgi:hypothetical protein
MIIVGIVGDSSLIRFPNLSIPTSHCPDAPALVINFISNPKLSPIPAVTYTACFRSGSLSSPHIVSSPEVCSCTLYLVHVPYHRAGLRTRVP